MKNIDTAILGSWGETLEKACLTPAVYFKNPFSGCGLNDGAITFPSGPLSTVGAEVPSIPVFRMDLPDDTAMMASMKNEHNEIFKRELFSTFPVCIKNPDYIILN
tara:strand:+ start:353 stop:667 length:315 start_codon:yes stop_codon:yes gene_type:complete